MEIVFSKIKNMKIDIFLLIGLIIIQNIVDIQVIILMTLVIF